MKKKSSQIVKNSIVKSSAIEQGRKMNKTKKIEETNFQSIKDAFDIFKNLPIKETTLHRIIAYHTVQDSAIIIKMLFDYWKDSPEMREYWISKLIFYFTQIYGIGIMQGCKNVTEGEADEIFQTWFNKLEKGK